MEDTTTTYNLFVNLLEGKTLNLKFTTPTISAALIKRRLHEITNIPLIHQRLVTGTRHLDDASVLLADPSLPTVHLLLRLAGGKGGFGSLLRGAATKAGQKKTSNFDACRDMSGRRLRHVNAENKLQEWRATKEQREMEKKGEEFLKSLAKKGKKGTGDASTEKYVDKYREESKLCALKVEESVKEAMMMGKRKGKGLVQEEEEPKSKKMKIWMGKHEIDSEDDDSENEEGKEKSVVLNNGNSSGSDKEAESSMGSVTKHGGKTSGRNSSEEEKETVVYTVEEYIPSDKNSMLKPVIQDENIATTASVPDSAPDAVLEDVNGPEMDNLEVVVSQPQNITISGDEMGLEASIVVSEANVSSESSPIVQEEPVANGKTAELEKPLNFDEFNSAAEMEVLGLERLKSELQACGLKCGGTLQERAARLFLLKTTPIEKIPKKLLAKK